MLGMWLTGVGLGIKHLDAHFLHQHLHPLAANGMPVLAQHLAAGEGELQMPSWIRRISPTSSGEIGAGV